MNDIFRRRCAYALGILGYALAMTMSMAGHVPGGLLVVCATALVATRLSGPRPG